MSRDKITEAARKVNTDIMEKYLRTTLAGGIMRSEEFISLFPTTAAVYASTRDHLQKSLGSRAASIASLMDGVVLSVVDLLLLELRERDLLKENKEENTDESG